MKRHIFRAAVAVAIATTGVFGAPATASAGGIEPTRQCIEAAAYDFLGNPYTIKRATLLVTRTKSCTISLAAHVVERENREEWVRCLEYGLARSVPPLMWDPFVAALYDCTSRWLEFEVQIDPYP